VPPIIVFEFWLQNETESQDEDAAGRRMGLAALLAGRSQLDKRI